MPAQNKMEVIPAIDILGGRVVRLYQGDFEQVTEYENHPRVLAERYADYGAKRLHIVDLDGARTGTPKNTSAITELAQTGLELQIGGGIRSIEGVMNLLDDGASRVVIGSIAVNEPEHVTEWLREVGPRRIILAFDVQLNDRRVPEVRTHGWTEDSDKTLWPLVEYFLARGAVEFLCTDIAKDGTLRGPNTELYEACVERFPEAEFIASGGISGAEDLRALDATGVTRAVTGKALLDGRLTVEEIRQFSHGE